MEIQRLSKPAQHYLYVDRETSFSGEEIAKAMGSGFGEVFTFSNEKGITPISMPAAIYMEMPSGDGMKLRLGFFVTAEDAKRTEGTINSAVIPAGEVVTATHVGPYSSLNVSHKALWDFCDDNQLEKVMPVWEIYVDDPEKTPEEKLRTEIYRFINSESNE